MPVGWRWLVLWLLLGAIPATADPGLEVARGATGSLRWYLYAESPGLILGEGAVGVLLEALEGGVRLEPALELEWHAPDDSLQIRIARPGFADNLLMQGAPVFFHQTGVWTLRAYSLGTGQGALFETRLEVRAGPGLWRRAWPWLLLPGLVLLLATVTRSDRGARRRSSRRSPGP